MHRPGRGPLKVTRPNFVTDTEFDEFVRDAPKGTYDLFSDPVESAEERRMVEQAERQSRELQARRSE